MEKKVSETQYQTNRRSRERKYRGGSNQINNRRKFQKA